MIQELDIVSLTHDIPEENLKRARLVRWSIATAPDER
jgi:hypothetical protein